MLKNNGQSTGLSPSELASSRDFEEPSELFERMGIPPQLFWGFVGLLLFMIGDGGESGFLSPYL
jgi:hypothetical protein